MNLVERLEHARNLVLRNEKHIGENVLVFGASNRGLIEELVARDKKVTLIDVRQSAFEGFKELDIELKLVKEHEEFSGLNDTYDTIFFYDTLHHVKNKDQKIRECSSILNKNGVVLIYEPNIYSKLAKEYDRFGELKNSIYKFNLIRKLEENNFSVKLLSSEKLLSRRRIFKRMIIFLQKNKFDPRFRILLLGKNMI